MNKRSVTTERIYSRLPETYRAADELNDGALKNYIASLLDQYDVIHQYISRFEYLPESERTLDASEYNALPVYEIEDYAGRPHFGEVNDYIPVAINLATNPSFETTSGTVEVSRNLIQNPSFETTGNTIEYQRNLVPNPTFTVGTDMWNARGGALSAYSWNNMWLGQRGDRVRTGQLTSDGTSAYLGIEQDVTAISVVGGQWIAVSALIACDPQDNIGCRMDVVLPTPSGWTYRTSPGSWQPAPFYEGRRVTWAFQAPESATRFGVRAQMYSGSAATMIPAGRRLWLSDVQAATAATEAAALGQVQNYFDGSTSPISGLVPSWTGAANASESVLTGTGVAGVYAHSSLALIQTRFALAVREGEYAGAATVIGVPSAYSYIGQDVTVSAGQWLATATPARASGTSQRVTPRMDFYNGATLLSGNWGTRITAPAGVYVTPTNVAQAPAGTTRARVYLYMNSTTTDEPLPGASLHTDAWVACAASTEADALAQVANYFDGSVSPDPDLTPSWTGTANGSESVLRGAVASGSIVASTTKAISSTQWAASGTRSVRTIPQSESADTSVVVAGSSWNLGQFEAGNTYTALVRMRLAAAQTGTLSAKARRIEVYYNNVAGWAGAGSMISDAAPNVAGEHDIRATFTIPSDSVWASLRLVNGASVGRGDVWWDNFALIEGEYDGPWFDGSHPVEGYDAAWQGTENYSTSTLHGRFTNKPIGSTSDLVDPATANEEWLPWIRQLFPVGEDYSSAEESRSAMIAMTENNNRGSLIAIEDAIRRLLIGTQRVLTYKRSSLAGIGSQSVWDILVVTSPGEYTGTSLHNDLLRMGAKPAGVVIHHRTYTADWDTVQTSYPSWDSLDGQRWQTIEMTGL